VRVCDVVVVREESGAVKKNNQVVDDARMRQTARRKQLESSVG